MKKLLKLLFALSLLVLVACGSSSSVQVDDTNPEELGNSGTLTYLDRQIELQEVKAKHKEKYVWDNPEKYIAALNKEYGQEFFEVLRRDYENPTNYERHTNVHLDYTTAGYQYFTGVDIEEVRAWWDGNPFRMFHPDFKEETRKMNTEDVDRNNRLLYQKHGARVELYTAYIASDYLELSNLATEEKYLSDQYTKLNIPFPVGSIKGQLELQPIKKDAIEEVFQELPNLLTEAEREVIEVPSDYNWAEHSAIFYNTDRDYIAEVDFGFSVPRVESEEPDWFGLNVIIKKDSSGFEILDKRLDAPDLRP